jgi:hypothetical protein
MKTFEIILEDEVTKEKKVVYENGLDAEDALESLSEKYGYEYIIVKVIPLESEDEENDPAVLEEEEELSNTAPWNITDYRCTENILDYGDTGDIDDIIEDEE